MTLTGQKQYLRSSCKSTLAFGGSGDADVGREKPCMLRLARFWISSPLSYPLDQQYDVLYLSGFLIMFHAHVKEKKGKIPYMSLGEWGAGREREIGPEKESLASNDQTRYCIFFPGRTLAVLFVFWAVVVAVRRYLFLLGAPQDGRNTFGLERWIGKNVHNIFRFWKNFNFFYSTRRESV